jgi:hypothetical protein
MHMAKTRVMLRIDPDRLAAVDAKAGSRGRTAFIERAIDAALDGGAPATPEVRQPASQHPATAASQLAQGPRSVPGPGRGADRRPVSPVVVEPRWKSPKK